LQPGTRDAAPKAKAPFTNSLRERREGSKGTNSGEALLFRNSRVGEEGLDHRKQRRKEAIRGVRVALGARMGEKVHIVSAIPPEPGFYGSQYARMEPDLAHALMRVLPEGRI
jgi:hypothetical protein